MKTTNRPPVLHWDHPVVWATHPKVLNLTRNARGRVIHMARKSVDDKFDYPATFCGMRISFGASRSDYESRGMCIQCENIYHQEAVCELCNGTGYFKSNTAEYEGDCPNCATGGKL